MITFEISNCNNITSATVQLEKNCLNIYYAMNGIGKSTVAQAINCIPTIKDVYNLENISDLKPFDSDLEPTCKPSEPINKCVLFNEAFVEKIVFQENEVIQNSFEVFIKTPEYEELQNEIKQRLNTLTFHHTGLHTTTPIVVSGLTELDQTIWGTMERHFELKITKPLRF